jgi:hypothetical protein
MKLTLLAALALGLSALSLEAAAQQSYPYGTHPRQQGYSQQDQSYLDPGPPPPRVHIPNYVAIGESDFSQPFYDSMSDPGGSDFETFSNE